MGIIANGKTIGTAKVISNDLVPKGASVCGRKLQSITYITLHNTGLIGTKANNFHRSLKRENALTNGRQASWHFTVDDIEIYQEVDTTWETWHAGNSTGNKNSISIEMCMWNDKEQQRKTYDNSARLVAELMKMHNIPITKVVQHNNWSGKNCPQFLRESKHGYNWSWFIEQVKKYYNGTTSSTPSTPSTSNDYKRIVGTIEILADSLNVRKDADFNSAVVTTLNKGQKVSVMAIKNGLYMIKEGQWCSAGEKYVKYTETKEDVYEVTADTLNVRKGRGTEHEKVGALKKGDKIAIWSVAKNSKEENWGSFRYSFTPDIVGFVSMAYLERV